MSVLRGSPRVFRSARAILGESLVWAGPDDLLWCDITAGALNRSPLHGPIDGSADRTISLPPPLASFHPARAGGYIASLGDRIVLVDPDAASAARAPAGGAIVRELARIDHAHDGIRMNEGKVDPEGRWVSGSMDLTEGEPDAAIYSIGAEGGLRVIHDGLTVANGFEWSADGSRMYFGDTAAKTIYVGDYSADGELARIEVFHEGASHDGLTIDADGYLWSGIYGGGRVVRYTPDGREDEVVELPAPNITSVAFGGEGMSTLFVSSARENLSEGDLRAHPLSGSVFAIDTGTHGKPPREFG